MTLTKLKERAAFWQGVLNLPEWKISVRWMTAEEGKKNLGHCKWSTEELTATVKIRKGGNDHEATLLHELIHVVFQGHADYDEYDAHIERAINRMTAALMARP